MAYSKKIYQLQCFHGMRRWTTTDSHSALEPALARFAYCVDDDAPRTYEDQETGRRITKTHRKDWSKFSYRLVNKETGEVLRRHVGRAAKYVPFGFAEEVALG